MLKGFIVLLVFFLAGEFIAKLFAWPVPGSIIGMLLLFALLMVRGAMPVSLKHSSDTMLPYLPLFVVPASVGIVNHLHLLQQDGLIMIIAMVVSLLLGIPLCGWLMQRMLNGRAK